MLMFIVRRLLGIVPTLWLLCTLTFFLLRLAPGGPFDTDRAWPPEIQANIDRKYELDRPVAVQYAHWLRDIARGDLRESFQYVGRPVTRIISDAIPVSLLLGSLALVFAVGIGIPLGAIAAWKRGTWLDSSAVFLAVTGVSLPSYLVASLLILVFSLKLNWLPPALWEGPSSWVLPSIALGSRPLAIVARLTRASLLEALSSDYVRTAFGKGLSERQVVLKHALRNSLIPVVTVLGPVAAGLLTGSFLIEIVFQVPGLGKHFVQAVTNRDYPLVMGVTLVYGVVLLLSNLAVDLAYGVIDPRMRLKEDG
jgi:oligopeptide transport system permease protein